MSSIANHLALIEAEIKKKKFGQEPSSLYEPIRYIMKLGGKRLRPLLTLLSYSLYKKSVSDIVSYACAVEAFHNFTLMHDDIMDKAPVRRGKPTVHKKWNLSTAILSGDVMLVKVYEIFSGLDADKFKDVVITFNSCASEVCEGQQWDMEFEQSSRVNEKEYLEMIRRKTAVLLGFSLELGAILANASEEDRKALREFGINIGMGFQLRDDLLDAYADPKKFGKQIGGDIIANKKTFLLIKAFENARGKNKAELNRWLTSSKFNKKEKISAVKQIYDDLKIQRLTEQKIDHFFVRGFKSLDKLDSSLDTSQLADFTRSMINRQI
ncbi:MAG TPA: polyprenyl synthetase family protein [Cyclobacteriaceae bacterium]|nr:polyprenyl synthetase family protein [Cyclobacteriaceae bacterium]